jgi:hypothetical protein
MVGELERQISSRPRVTDEVVVATACAYGLCWTVPWAQLLRLVPAPWSESYAARLEKDILEARLRGRLVALQGCGFLEWG